MACAVPLVGTAVGGLLDTVINGVTGLLTPPGQPRAAAAAVTRLLGDAHLRRALGAAGLERVLGTTLGSGGHRDRADLPAGRARLGDRRASQSGDR